MAERDGVVSSPAVPSSEQRVGRKRVNITDTERWLTSIGGGALAAYGLMRRSWTGAALALAGGYMVYRSMSGYCPTYHALGARLASKGSQAVHVQKAVTIDTSPDELYQFWRNFENLPRFMQHLESVTVHDERRSHWVAKAPAGTVEWDAEIVEDRPNELIAWRSAPEADIHHAGSVQFKPAPAGRGTEVHVTLEYRPPAGAVGAAVAKLFGEEPAQQVADDLRNLKQIMEAGEIATTAGQPSGSRSLVGRVLSPRS